MTTDHTPPTDAELAEIRERSSLSCGDRKHGVCNLFDESRGPCAVCVADGLAISDRPRLLAEIDRLRGELHRVLTGMDSQRAAIDRINAASAAWRNSVTETGEPRANA